MPGAAEVHCPPEAEAHERCADSEQNLRRRPLPGMDAPVRQRDHHANLEQHPQR